MRGISALSLEMQLGSIKGIVLRYGVAGRKLSGERLLKMCAEQRLMEISIDLSRLEW